MSSIFGEQGEKKVEYLELIYDLIFVYLIGRNNSLLQSVHNGFVYDHIVDRNLSTNGTVYMFIHIFLITAQNFITTGLEFMQEDSVAAIPKTVFLTVSFLMYYIFLSQTAHFARFKPLEGQRIYRDLGVACAVFAVLMALTYRSGYLSIAVSVLFIYAVFWHLYLSWKKSAA